MLEKILTIYWKSFLYRLWLGEIQLTTCFWLYYLLLQYGLVFILMMIGVPVWVLFGFTRVYTFIALSILGIYLFIATIGTWRSSDKYSNSKASTLIVKGVLIFISIYYAVFFVILLPYVDQSFYYTPPR